MDLFPELETSVLWTALQMEIGEYIYTCIMMMSSNGNIFCFTGPSCRGMRRSSANSTNKGQWRVVMMLSFIFAWNKRLSKRSGHRWFETPSRSLWRHCNEYQRISAKYEWLHCIGAGEYIFILIHPCGGNQQLFKRLWVTWWIGWLRKLLVKLVEPKSKEAYVV